VFLRGSGCAPLFVINEDGASSNTSIFQDIVAPRLERFHFAMIENPGVEPLRFAAGMTLQAKRQAFARSETECSNVYRVNQTKGARVNDVLTALSAFAGQAWVQQSSRHRRDPASREDGECRCAVFQRWPNSILWSSRWSGR
jgi:hypothetical protein